MLEQTIAATMTMMMTTTGASQQKHHNQQQQKQQHQNLTPFQSELSNLCTLIIHLNKIFKR